MAISLRTCGLIVVLTVGSALSTAAAVTASDRLTLKPSGVVPCASCGLDLARPDALPQGFHAPAAPRSHPSCAGTFRHGTTGRKSRLLRAVSRVHFPRFESVAPLQPDDSHSSYPDLIPPAGDDPNDNETSGDPTEDDDDDWNDLNGNNDTHLPIIVWSCAWVSRANAPDSAPAVRTQSSTSLFLTLERLRC